MKKSLILSAFILSFFYQYSLSAQSFHKVTVDVIKNQGKVNQMKLSSYIYLGNFNDYNSIKQEIYSYFDGQINIDSDNYNPSVDLTVSNLLFIYKKTSTLNENYVFDEGLNPEKNPLIDGFNQQLLAIVSYQMIGETKSIIFYENNSVVKYFIDNTERILNSNLKSSLRLENMF